MTPFGRQAIAAAAAIVGALLLGFAAGYCLHPEQDQTTPPYANAEVGPDAAAPAPPMRRIQVDGREVLVDSRDRVTFEHQDTVTDIGGSHRSDKNASTTGIGLVTSANEVAQSFEAENARTELDGVGAAAGGGFSYEGKLKGLGSGLNAFSVIGIAFLLGAAAFIVGPMIAKLPIRWGTAAMLAAIGVAFIAIGVSVDKLPGAWAIGGLLIAVALGVWFIIGMRKDKKAAVAAADTRPKDEALEAIVATVNEMGDASTSEFKATMNRILKAKGADVRAEVETLITKFKGKLGL